MKNVKHLSPDATTSTGNVTTNTSTNSTSNIPKSDADFLHTMESVASKWAQNSAITLLWITQAEFATKVQNYRTAFTARSSTGSNRPALTKILNDLDKKADDAVREVKVYIEKKFKKINAIPQFSRYGIVKLSNGYRLPKDRNKRLEALTLMKAAITTDGFDNEEYGKTFWTTLDADYTTAFTAAGSTAGTVSTKVATKNQLKKEITEVSVALLLVLKGNYPKTYAGVYRDWGWKK